jgi:hypothetical protein
VSSIADSRERRKRDREDVRLAITHHQQLYIGNVPVGNSNRPLGSNWITDISPVGISTVVLT